MSFSVPSSLKDRESALRDFSELSSIEQGNCIAKSGNFGCLMVLWGMGELPLWDYPTPRERRRTLIAYKVLGWVWYEDLPEYGYMRFSIYVCNALPDNQHPEQIDSVFRVPMGKLIARSKQIEKPRWVTRRMKTVLVSVDSFPRMY